MINQLHESLISGQSELHSAESPTGIPVRSLVDALVNWTMGWGCAFSLILQNHVAAWIILTCFAIKSVNILWISSIFISKGVGESIGDVILFWVVQITQWKYSKEQSSITLPTVRFLFQLMYPEVQPGKKRN